VVNHGEVPLPVFFGLLGVINAVGLLPIVAIFHWTGVERLDAQVGRALPLIVVKGLLDNVLADFLWAKAITLTSPTVATVGLSLTIPLAMLSDWWLKGMPPSPGLLIGSVLVLAGFVAINVGSSEHESDEAQSQGNQCGCCAKDRASDGLRSRKTPATSQS